MALELLRESQVEMSFSLERPTSATPKIGETKDMRASQIPVTEHYFIGPFHWWIYEYDKEDDIAFGFVNLNDPQMAELGSISMKELETVSIMGMVVTRDRNWKSTQLSVVMDSVSSQLNARK